jgi:hypothetical protein
MKQLTDEQMHIIWDKLNKENKDVTETDWDWCLQQILAYTGGKVFYTHNTDVGAIEEEPEHQVHFAILADVTHRITDDQLCDIFDMGNHCSSVGAITYELSQNGTQLAYLHWSNLGHI